MTYDGVLEGPARTQTVPYVRGLRDRGHDTSLLSFERAERLPDAVAIAAVEAELDGVPWERLRWRRRPAVDLVAGVRALRRAVRRRKADLVHARGYVPALVSCLAGRPFVFDMRGFWPDERADGGLWKRGGVSYRLWKRIERSLCARAKAIVVLTERARDELLRLGIAPADAAIRVIPTCADLDRFRFVPRDERPAEAAGGAPRYVILGATGTWYLRDEMLDLAALALERDADAVLHVLTADPPGPLEAALDARGVPAGRRLVRRVRAADVPAWISGAEAAIVLIRSTWSKGASCPTKLAELLGCGVPLLMNGGIGDADRILGEERVGVTVGSFDPRAYGAALDALERLAADGREALSRRCRALAEARFSLPLALDAYEAAYADARGRVA